MRQSEVRFFMLQATRLILNYHKLKAAQPAVHGAGASRLSGHSKLILCLGGPAPPRRPAGRPRLIIDNPGPAARPRAHAEIIGVIARTTRAF